MIPHFCPVPGCRQVVPDYAPFCPMHATRVDPDTLDELMTRMRSGHYLSMRSNTQYRELVNNAASLLFLADLPRSREPGQEG